MTVIPDLEAALELVKKCTVKQIKAVLRAKRDSDDVRLSAPKKEDLIQINLREALTSGAVSMTAVYNLIRESEENGDQHVWYYRIPAKLSEVLEFEPVAQRLLGPKWEEKLKVFPSLTLMPEDFVVSDLRKTEGKPKDWVLKIYGHASINQAVGGLQAEDDGTLWQEFRVISLRSVLVVRRNGSDLLEIRVQRDGSNRRVKGWEATVWKILQPVVLKQQLPSWDLTKAINNLILQCDKHTDLYDFRDAGVLDPVAKVLSHHESVSDQGNLMGSKNVVDSLKKAVAEGHTIRELAVNWLSEKTSLEESLRVLIGAQGTNEMLVPSHCSASDLDHVTDQLRRFMK